MKSKQELRRTFRGLLNKQETAQGVSAAVNKDHDLCDRLVQRLSDESGIWAAYQPIGFEADVRQALPRLPNITFVFPRIEGDELMFYRSHSDAHFISNQLGILEPDPLHAEHVELSQIQGLLIPALAFDLKLNRLGRGGGFYDRALARIASANHNVIKLGIARDLQISEETFPSESFDVPMDLIVTESRVLTANPLNSSIHSRKTS